MGEITILNRILSKIKASRIHPDPARTPSAELESTLADGKQHVVHLRGTSGAGVAARSSHRGFAHKLAECRVVSLPDSVHRSNIDAFVKGADRRIILKRDEYNRFDKNAIKVIGIWQDARDLCHIDQIGWLPSDITFKIAIEASGSSLGAEVISTSPALDIRGPHVQISILCS